MLFRLMDSRRLALLKMHGVRLFMHGLCLSFGDKSCGLVSILGDSIYEVGDLVSILGDSIYEVGDPVFMFRRLVEIDRYPYLCS